MRLDPDQLSALAVILRRGSFDAAATELSVTPSAISQRIKALEDRIGAVLIQRGTPCSATPAGAILARHAEDVRLLESRLAREMQLDAPSTGVPVLRIALNADSLATWFIPAIANVPDLLFDLVLDDQDHSADWLKRGEVSAAVTEAGEPVTGCDFYPLGTMRYIATASPAFMRRWFPDGVTTEALSRAPCVTFNAKDMLQRRWIENRTGRRLSPPCHFVPSTGGFLDAVRAGLGWGLNPEPLILGPIRNGRLAAMAPDLPLDVPLGWQVSRLLAPALEPLTTAVRHTAAKQLYTKDSA